MARFDRQIKSALRLIEKNGQVVTWRQPQRTQNFNEPWKVASAAPINHSPRICFLPVDKETRELIAYLRGNNELKSGSVIGLMGNVSFTPAATDFVIRDGVNLEIASIDVLSPNGQKILYTVEFKG